MLMVMVMVVVQDIVSLFFDFLGLIEPVALSKSLLNHGSIDLVTTVED